MRVTFRGTALHDIGHLYLADGYEHLSTELPARQGVLIRGERNDSGTVVAWRGAGCDVLHPTPPKAICSLKK